MNEKRLDWLDVAKGYGILFVIYAHTDYGFIGNLLYTFHVPLFFFLSGFVFSNKYDFKTFFIKKIKAIVIPYFLYGIPMFISQVVYMKTRVVKRLCYTKAIVDTVVYCLSLLAQYFVLLGGNIRKDLP